jgi:ketosteroid isomerase-like protein
MRTLAVITVLLLVAACQTPPPPGIAGVEAIQETAPLFEAYTAGMVGGDAQAIAALYSSDPVEMTPGDFRNRADIVSHYEEMTESFEFPVWDFEPIDAWIHGDAAYVISRVNISQAAEDGSVTPYELYSTMRLLKEDGEWKIDRNVVGQR